MPSPTLTVKEAKNFAIKKSINGYGIFTRHECKGGAVLFEVTGPKVKCEEGDGMSEEERSNTFRFSKVWYLNPKGRLGEMLNHSCEPNARLVKKNEKLFVVALSNIPKGKEVLLDYSTMLAGDDSWTMRCNCGTPHCRKVIKKFKLLPKALQQAYLKQKMVPAYVRQ